MSLILTQSASGQLHRQDVQLAGRELGSERGAGILGEAQVAVEAHGPLVVPANHQVHAARTSLTQPRQERHDQLPADSVSLQSRDEINMQVRGVATDEAVGGSPGMVDVVQRVPGDGREVRRRSGWRLGVSSAFSRPPVTLQALLKLMAVEGGDDVAADTVRVLRHECQRGLEGQIGTKPDVSGQSRIADQVGRVVTACGGLQANLVQLIAVTGLIRPDAKTVAEVCHRSMVITGAVITGATPG